MEALVEDNVVIPILVPVAFTNSRPVDETTLRATLVPVALPNSRPVDETTDITSLPNVVMVPVADTLNCEVELVWKSRKLPPNEVGLIPI